MPDSEEIRALPSDKLILIIDDDPGVRELLEMTLGKEGFRTVLAVDGEDGMKKIEAEEPDLIILDLMLPKSGGYEVLRDFQSAGHGSIPVIVITGRITDQGMKDMIKQESNVLDFLEKPIKPAIFGLTLHKILKTSPPSGTLKPLGE